MKRKVICSMALLAAVAMGNAPMNSYAAEIKVVQVQNGEYKVLNGGESWDAECVQEVLDRLGISIEQLWQYCPEISEPECPDTEAPEQPDTPDTEAPAPEQPDTPDTEAPALEQPDTSDPEALEPEEPEQPDTEAPAPEESDTPDTEAPAPEQPEQPDTEAPAPEQPGTSSPELPDSPETEAPDTQLSYAEQVVKLVNEERAKAGLPAVTVQTDITAAANVRAREIKQSFSHTRPNGSSFSTALKEQGVSFMGSGENIAYGQKTPEQVMEGWMNSDGHRANILNANFKHIGVGYYQDERGVNYWVQLFTY